MNHWWCVVTIGIVFLRCSSEAERFIPKTPADVRFAARRCLAGKSLNDTLQLSNGDSCAAKCFLMKLGVINLQSRGLDIEKLSRLWGGVKNTFQMNIQCMMNFWLEEPLNDRCSSYHHKLMEFRQSCPEIYEKSFTGYDNAGLSKIIGQTVTDFCKYIGAKNKALQFCVLNGFHYFDGYGRLDENEVFRSYREAQSWTADNKALIKQCVHAGNCLYDNYEEMSATLIDCLNRTTKVFPRVYRRRNNLSRHY